MCLLRINKHYVNWGNLRQGSKTVSEYIQERERLVVLCDINEPEEMKIGRFLGDSEMRLGRSWN